MDKEKEVKKKTKIRDICILQAVIAVYTLSTVFAKFASGQEFLSFIFLLCNKKKLQISQSAILYIINNYSYQN